jgi:hypothetical protein
MQTFDEVASDTRPKVLWNKGKLLGSKPPLQTKQVSLGDTHKAAASYPETCPGAESNHRHADFQSPHLALGGHTAIPRKPVTKKYPDPRNERRTN